jgi:hypothetical protein
MDFQQIILTLQKLLVAAKVCLRPSLMTLKRVPVP